MKVNIKKYLAELSKSVGSEIVYEKFLGEGTYGYVVSGYVREYNMSVAIKMVCSHDCRVNDLSQDTTLRAEYEISKKMGNLGIGPFIVLLDCVIVGKKACPCIIMELFDASVSTLISKNKDMKLNLYLLSECNKLIDKMISGGNYFYDIKPGNFVYKVGRMCMIDFDIRFQLQPSRLHKKYLPTILKIQMFVLSIIHVRKYKELIQFYEKDINRFFKDRKGIEGYFDKNKDVYQTIHYYCKISHDYFFSGEEDSLFNMVSNITTLKDKNHSFGSLQIGSSRTEDTYDTSGDPVLLHTNRELSKYIRNLRDFLGF